MGSKRETADQVVTALGEAGPVRTRAMFGEYAVYLDEKIIGWVADDDFFLKQTSISKEFLDDTHLGLPYPNAKPAMRVPKHRWDDHAWLANFARATAAELPKPKAKK